MQKHNFKTGPGVFLSFALAAALHNWGEAAEAPYYQGKTITILEGRTSGGTGSLRTQAAAKYLAKYLPGNPSVVFQFMPAGGGLGAANHVATAAKQDGLTTGNVSSGVFSSALKEAFHRVWKDPQFLADYERMTQEKADPMTTDDFDELLRNIPQDPKVMETYKQLLAAGPLPPSR